MEVKHAMSFISHKRPSEKTHTAVSCKEARGRGIYSQINSKTVYGLKNPDPDPSHQPEDHVCRSYSSTHDRSFPLFWKWQQGFVQSVGFVWQDTSPEPRLCVIKGIFTCKFGSGKVHYTHYAGLSHVRIVGNNSVCFAPVDALQKN